MSHPAPATDTPRAGVLRDVLAVVLILFIGVAGYYIGYGEMEGGHGRSLPPDPRCNLSMASCRVNMEGIGEVTVAFAAQPVPLLKPFVVTVTPPASVRLRQVSMDFTGAEMNMGLNRVVLPAQGGAYRGEATLPLCVTGRMLWRATLTLDTGTETVSMPFLFYTGD